MGNHLVLWDLKPQGITGSKFEKICDKVSITLNKNCVPGDRSAVTPGGVRIGTPALTTRMMGEEDFQQIAVFFIEALKKKVHQFATGFPMPGFDPTKMKYQDVDGP